MADKSIMPVTGTANNYARLNDPRRKAAIAAYTGRVVSRATKVPRNSANRSKSAIAYEYAGKSRGNEVHTAKKAKKYNTEGIARAAQRRLETTPTKKYKGKYIGPDKYKGKIPKHLRDKYKGKYFGKESGKGRNE